MYNLVAGSSLNTIQILLRDAITGQTKSGLTAASDGGNLTYVRQNGSAVTVSLVALGSATAPWTAGGFIEVDQGVYRVDLPDAAAAVGATFVSVRVGFTGTLSDAVLCNLVASPSAGAGGFQVTLSVTNSAGGAPLAGVNVWLTTDLAGANVVAGALPTGTGGTVTFLVAAGTYYVWAMLNGFAGSLPSAITVTTTGGFSIQLTANAVPATLTVSGLSHTPRLTVADEVERLYDYVGADPGDNVNRQVKKALLDGLTEFASAAVWTYLMAAGRLQLYGALQNGLSIQYQQSSGAYPYLVTLTGSTWPTWMLQGFLRFNPYGPGVLNTFGTVTPSAATIYYPIARIISSTQLQLFPDQNPGADVAAGTPATVARDTYTLPADLIATDTGLVENNWGGMLYTRPAEWLRAIRYQEMYSQPQYFTIIGDPVIPGRLALRLYPCPDRDQTLDFFYYRRPRAVAVMDYNQGKATVNVGTNAQLITIQGGTCTPQWVGSVLRLSATANQLPTGPTSTNPAAYEGNITGIVSQSVSSCSVTVDVPVAQTYTGVAYRVSDPIDVEQAMLPAFARCCEKHLSLMTKADNTKLADAAYRQALVLAREADARVMQRREAGSAGAYRQRLATMPRGADIE